jgi:hypothetical protein
MHRCMYGSATAGTCDVSHVRGYCWHFNLSVQVLIRVKFAIHNNRGPSRAGGRRRSCPGQLPPAEDARARRSSSLSPSFRRADPWRRTPSPTRSHGNPAYQDFHLSRTFCYSREVHFVMSLELGGVLAVGCGGGTGGAVLNFADFAHAMAAATSCPMDLRTSELRTPLSTRSPQASR